MSASLQQDALLGYFSVLAYNDNGLPTPRQAPLPDGWTKLDQHIEGSYASFAYVNDITGQVVIAYRGWDGVNDIGVATAIAFGNWSVQFDQAAQFTAQVRDQVAVLIPNAEILTPGSGLAFCLLQCAVDSRQWLDADGCQLPTSSPHSALGTQH